MLHSWATQPWLVIAAAVFIVVIMGVRLIRRRPSPLRVLVLVLFTVTAVMFPAVVYIDNTGQRWLQAHPLTANLLASLAGLPASFLVAVAVVDWVIGHERARRWQRILHLVTSEAEARLKDFMAALLDSRLAPHMHAYMSIPGPEPETPADAVRLLREDLTTTIDGLDELVNELRAHPEAWHGLRPWTSTVMSATERLTGAFVALDRLGVLITRVVDIAEALELVERMIDFETAAARWRVKALATERSARRVAEFINSGQMGDSGPETQLAHAVDLAKKQLREVLPVLDKAEGLFNCLEQLADPRS